MTPRSPRWLPAVGALALLLAALATPPAGASGPPERGATTARAVGASAASSREWGWRVVAGATGVSITWRSRQPVPLGDAALEFRLGDTVLGTPRSSRDGRTFALHLDGPLGGREADLEVTAGGLPLDARGRPALPLATRGTTSPSAGSGVAARRSTIDPGVAGPYPTKTSDYDLGGVDVGGFAAPTEVLGTVVSPVGAPGARPLVLFLHGRHSTCYRGGPNGRSSGDWPCRPGWQPIPSQLGYLDSQELLASQGYVTVSIAANGVNGQDWEALDGGAEARSELVRHHLSLWSTWATAGGGPFGDAFVGGVDLGHVLLVGHSRGGEGVNRAAIDTRPRDPWNIDGQVLIGPTAFGRQTALGVDTTVLLPYCDGDVYDLQGQQYVDQSRDLLPVGQADPALRSAVLVMGANHNFFNSQWTPGESAAPSSDDWWNRKDPVCGTRARLAPTKQRSVGAVYVATSAAAFVEHRPAALRLLNGTAARPASLGDATTHVAALGARRTPAYLPSPDLSAPRATGATAVVCEGYRNDPALPTCARGSVPSFLPMYGAPGAPAPTAVRVRWNHPGGSVTLPAGGAADLSRSSVLQLRVAVAAGGGPARFGVALVDGGGLRYDLGTRTLRQLPGGRSSLKVWGQSVRLPLAGGGGGPLAGLRAIRITPLSDHGSVVLLDAYGRRPGFSAAPVPSVPRVDVVGRRIVEGDGGERTEQIRVELTGAVSGTERVWVAPDDPGFGRVPGYEVALTPGQTVIEVPIAVSGDTRDDYDLLRVVVVKGLRSVVTGRYVGAATVADDDPAPVLRPVRTWLTATEGQRLRWDLRLSAPSDKWVWLSLRPSPPPTGTELTVADLGVRFRERHRLPTGDRQVPLSASRLWLGRQFEPGQTAARISLPIRQDGADESPERVVLDSQQDPDLRVPWKLRGEVTDA